MKDTEWGGGCSQQAHVMECILRTLHTCKSECKYTSYFKPGRGLPAQKSDTVCRTGWHHCGDYSYISRSRNLGVAQ